MHACKKKGTRKNGELGKGKVIGLGGRSPMRQVAKEEKDLIFTVEATRAVGGYAEARNRVEHG